jgi:ATP-dependent DNA helicase RecQ
MKKDALLERVAGGEKPGIVYVATRRHAEEIVGALTERNVKATFYHAGMKSRDRIHAQEAFMADEVEVIVATSAFGMGIDKPNVRFVYHYDISESIDSYYQEIGRAGRDGEKAKALLFYYPKDLGIRHFFASGGLVDADEVEQVAIVVQAQDGPVGSRDLREETGLSQSKLVSALSCLQEIGTVEILATGEAVRAGQAFNLDEVVEAAERIQGRRRQFERSRVEMMRGYAELHDCRREYLLNYFGEEKGDPCGFCDNCEAGISMKEEEDNLPFPINSRVVHKMWGVGMVLRYEGDKMVVLFDDVGYKTLAVDVVTEHNLLELAK